jgi:hypothetical protein
MHLNYADAILLGDSKTVGSDDESELAPRQVQSKRAPGGGVSGKYSRRSRKYSRGLKNIRGGLGIFEGSGEYLRGSGKYSNALCLLSALCLIANGTVLH